MKDAPPESCGIDIRVVCPHNNCGEESNVECAFWWETVEGKKKFRWIANSRDIPKKCHGCGQEGMNDYNLYLEQIADTFKRLTTPPV